MIAPWSVRVERNHPSSLDLNSYRPPFWGRASAEEQIMKRMRLAAWAALASLGLLSGCQSSDPCGCRPSLLSRLGLRCHSRATEAPVSSMPITTLAPDCCEGPILGNAVPYGIPSPGINGGPFLESAPPYPGFNGTDAPLVVPPDTRIPGVPGP